MYTVPQYKIEIRLIDRDGNVEVYSDYETFLEHVDYWFVNKHVVMTFKDWPEDSWYLRWKFGEKPEFYIVRDKFGSVFTPTEILEDIKEKNRSKNKLSQWFIKKHDFIYRETPVPLTGKRRWRWKFGDFYKTPRHAQEKRWNIAHKKYVRGKRSPKYLPNPWDDYPRTISKNWKNQRKTQWK